MTYENMTNSELLALINSLKAIFDRTQSSLIGDALIVLEGLLSERLDSEEDFYYENLYYESLNDRDSMEHDISNNFYEEEENEEFEWHDNPVYEPGLEDMVHSLLDLYPRDSLNDMMLDLMSGIDRVFYSFNGTPLLLSEEAEFITMSALSLLESRLKR